jgi:hypothetical protein
MYWRCDSSGIAPACNQEALSSNSSLTKKKSDIIKSAFAFSEKRLILLTGNILYMEENTLFTMRHLLQSGHGSDI